MQSQKKLIIKALVILLGFLIIASAVFFITSKSEVTSAQRQTKALIGGAFSLIDHNGKAVTEKDFAGQFTLIYFGYTYCPDVCPTELQILSEAYDSIDQKTKDKISLMFISIDPERDTVEQLKIYAPQFHDDLIGYTGTLEEIKAIKKTFRVYAGKAPNDSSTDYLMDHTSLIYLMDGKGEYVKHFSYGTSSEKIASYLKKHVK